MRYPDECEEEFKTPDWEDIMLFWDRCSNKERVKYVEDAFNCDPNSEIAQVIAKQKWDNIPDTMQESLEGQSQLGNDVFNTINDE